MSRSICRTIFAAVTLLVSASPAWAQRCLGTASFTTGTARLDVRGEFSDGYKAGLAGITLGSNGGLFAGASGGLLSADGASENATLITAHVGVAVAASEGGAVELCPVGTYARQSGPKVSSVLLGTADPIATTYGLGLSLGGVAGTSGSTEFVPFLSVAYNWASLTSGVSGSSASFDQNYTLLTGGFGLVLSRSVTVRPSVSYPLGVSGAKAVFGIGLSINAGGGA